MTDRILVAGPSITEREVELTAEAVRNACGPKCFEMVARFERAVADYCGRQYAVSTPNCTMALTLTLAALGIGPGDEVIVPDVTWIGSVAPIVHLGATPVLVDIRRDTWCIDVAAVERAIGPKTKAIIGVDLYGSMCDWGALELAVFDACGYPNDVALIEDAAESIGSRYKGRPSGSFGLASVFSFHGTKTVSTGEGGMVLTDDPDLYARLSVLRDQGRPTGDRRYEFTEFGYKARMSPVAAATGVAQMERIDELVAHKRRIFGWYRERLKGSMNVEPAGTLNSYWMTSFMPDIGPDKFTLMAAMDARNIDVRPFFSKLSSLPVFKDRPESRRFIGRGGDTGPVTWSEWWSHGVNLPSGAQVTEDIADQVCDALRTVLHSQQAAA